MTIHATELGFRDARSGDEAAVQAIVGSALELAPENQPEIGL